MRACGSITCTTCSELLKRKTININKMTICTFSEYPFIVDASNCMCSSTVIRSHLVHGVSPSVLANEIMHTVNRKRKEVVLAHPIPRVALYLRSLFPSFLFAVLAAGAKDSVLNEQMQWEKWNHVKWRVVWRWYISTMCCLTQDVSQAGQSRQGPQTLKAPGWSYVCVALSNVRFSSNQSLSYDLWSYTCTFCYDLSVESIVPMLHSMYLHV